MVLIPRNRIATHPGALLLEQIEEMGRTVHGVARALGLSAALLNEIVHERRDVNAETATALGTYFGQTPEFWLNAQKAYQLSKEAVEDEIGKAARGRFDREIAKLDPRPV